MLENTEEPVLWSGWSAWMGELTDRAGRCRDDRAADLTPITSSTLAASRVGAGQPLDSVPADGPVPLGVSLKTGGFRYGRRETGNSG